MKGFCFLLVCLIAFSVGLYGQEELTIDDIIDMVQAGLSDSFILQKLRISTLEYPPTVEDLVELRSAGVSERVILALMGVGSRGRLTSTSSAQTRYASEPMPHPEYELFGGYSAFFLDQTQDVRGWNVTSTNHFNNLVGLTIDGGGYYNGGFSQAMYTFLAGPQFSFRYTKWVTPYVRVLVGGTWVQPGLFNVTPVTGSKFGLGYGAGMGVDVNLKEGLALRVGPLDFIRLRVLGDNHDQLRVSAGIVGRW
jgi:opacity protein-like surface antigen